MLQIRRDINEFLQNRNSKSICICAGFYQRFSQYLPIIDLTNIDYFYTIDFNSKAGSDLIGDFYSKEILDYIPNKSVDNISFLSCTLYQEEFMHDESNEYIEDYSLLANYIPKVKSGGTIICNNLEVGYHFYLQKYVHKNHLEIATLLSEDFENYLIKYGHKAIINKDPEFPLFNNYMQYVRYLFAKVSSLPLNFIIYQQKDRRTRCIVIINVI